MTGYEVAGLGDIGEISGGSLACRPVRHHFGIASFGINAWTAAVVDDRILNAHDEAGDAEELYLVHRGRATSAASSFKKLLNPSQARNRCRDASKLGRYLAASPWSSMAGSLNPLGSEVAGPWHQRIIDVALGVAEPAGGRGQGPVTPPGND
jgi:hypothetical protein